MSNRLIIDPRRRGRNYYHLGCRRWCTNMSSPDVPGWPHCPPPGSRIDRESGALLLHAVVAGLAGGHQSELLQAEHHLELGVTRAQLTTQSGLDRP